MKPEEIAEYAGQVLRSGFGDRVAIGFFIGLMRPVKPERCAWYIKENKPLLYWLTDQEWKTYGKHAKGAKLDRITVEAIVERLKKRRPDLMEVINETPGGMDWLRGSIDGIKEKVRQACA